MIKKLIIILLICNVLILSSCYTDNTLQAVYFKNLTTAGSENYTISVNKLNDSSLKDLYVDILLKVDTDNLDFNLSLENNEPFKLYISKSYEYVSLTNLINTQTDYNINFETFNSFKNKTFILNSNQDVTFTFKAVAGKVSENAFKEQNAISSEFKISVKKTIK